MSNTKVHIEDYKGFGIYFDTQNSTFICDHADHYDLKTKQSFDAIKKYIDDYLKDNKEFKPFMVIRKSELMFGYNRFHGRQSKTTIIGLRKDKRYVTEDKKQISDFDEKDYVLYRESFGEPIAQIRKLEEELKEIEKSFKARINEISEPLLAQATSLNTIEKP